MMFEFDGASANAPIDATGSPSKIGFHTVPPSVVFHTPPPFARNNKCRDSPARPQPHSLSRRETARSSAISSPNRAAPVLAAPKLKCRQKSSKQLDALHTLRIANQWPCSSRDLPVAERIACLWHPRKTYSSAIDSNEVQCSTGSRAPSSPECASAVRRRSLVSGRRLSPSPPKNGLPDHDIPELWIVSRGQSPSSLELQSNPARASIS